MIAKKQDDKTLNNNVTFESLVNINIQMLKKKRKKHSNALEVKWQEYPKKNIYPLLSCVI